MQIFPFVDVLNKPIGIRGFPFPLNRSISEPLLISNRISPGTAVMNGIIELYEQDTRKDSIVIK